MSRETLDKGQMMTRSSLSVLFVSVCLLTTTSLAYGQQTAAKGSRRSGEALCVLSPADFTTAGVANAAKPSANVQDGGTSAYCVYAGKSGATGGIELDVFSPAGASPADIKETFRTAVGESSGGMAPLKIDGADEATWSAHSVSGGPPFATIAVRRGDLVFVLSIPPGKDAQVQLTSLSGLILKRL